MMWDEELIASLKEQFCGKRLRAGTELVDEGETIDEITDDFVIAEIERDYNSPDADVDEDDESWNWSVSHTVTVSVENGIVIDFYVEDSIYGDDGLGDFDPSEVFESEEYFDEAFTNMERYVEA